MPRPGAPDRTSADPSAPGRGAEFVLRVLAAGFYVTSWGIALLLISTSVAYFTVGYDGPAGVPGWAIAAWCGFSALFLVLAQFGAGRRRPAGRALEREQAPELFALIDAVASELRAGSVGGVRLKPGPMMAAAHVRRPGRFIDTEAKVLVIGLPVFRALSVDELRAAVAHELAHFAGGDVARGRIVNAAARRIALMISVLRRGGMLLTWFNPVCWYLMAYGAVLNGGSAAIRRRQEVRADRLGAGVVGASLYARALVRIAALDQAFRRHSPGILVRAVENEQRLDNYYEVFAEFHGQLPDETLARHIRDVATAETPGPSDHPPLCDRLASLEIDVEELVSSESDGPRAASLVPELSRVETEMTPLVLKGLMLGLGAQVKKRQKRREETDVDAALDALERAP